MQLRPRDAPLREMLHRLDYRRVKRSAHVHQHPVDVEDDHFGLKFQFGRCAALAAFAFRLSLAAGYSRLFTNLRRPLLPRFQPRLRSLRLPILPTCEPDSPRRLPQSLQPRRRRLRPAIPIPSRASPKTKPRPKSPRESRARARPPRSALPSLPQAPHSLLPTARSTSAPPAAPPKPPRANRSESSPQCRRDPSSGCNRRLRAPPYASASRKPVKPRAPAPASNRPRPAPSSRQTLRSRPHRDAK